LGLLKTKVGQLRQAIEYYKAAKKINPKNATLLNNLGNALIMTGQSSEGLVSLNSAIKIDECYAEAHRHIAFAKKYSEGDPHIEHLRTLLNTRTLDTNKESQLRFAYGKALNDIEQYESAFNEFLIGNELAKSASTYEISHEREFWIKIKRAYEKQINFGQILMQNYDKPKLVFVIGMPRSGTTLLAEVLSRTDKSRNIGETSIFEDLMLKHNVLDNEAKENSVSVIRHELITNISENPTDCMIIEKQLFNYYWLGHIKSYFPEAKVIYVRRDKASTCWSIFKNYFSAPRFGFSFDWQLISQLYDFHVNVMRYWRRHNIDFIEISYEEMVSKSGEVFQKIFDYIGIGWDDKYLSNVASRHTIITTNSTIQARKPIYQDAFQDWERYKHLSQDLRQSFESNVD
jgi:tetratricopeptide (TPR) repeat protein